ncbi:MAG: excinuclease ABC subunit UvrA, partial [Thermodesulfovibrionales bacterium]|nr:excinuclease ABC subunit UvrA [Thermodesulfovibrionales bacterium]
MCIRDRDSNDQKTELIFSSSLSCDYCNVSIQEPSPAMFSFSHPLFACPTCKGFGNVLSYNENALVPNKMLSLSEGAISILSRESLSDWREQFLQGARKSGIDIHESYKFLSDDEKELLFTGNSLFMGLNDLFSELEVQQYKVHVRVFLNRFRIAKTCHDCKGMRLVKEALMYKIDNLNISELSQKTISQLIQWLDNLQLTTMQQDAIKEPLRQIKLKLQFLQGVGLGYLTLDRQSKTISGGEYQRLNLANQLACQLTGTMYVLDEPTIGLHPRDTNKIINIIKKLVTLGNTAIVVEHDKDVIASGDYIVEMGPGGGANGGEIIFSGNFNDFIKSDTLTARALRKEPCIDCEISEFRPHSKSSDKFISLIGARGNNLKDVSVNIPINSLTVITGVSGSGKSSLIVETLYPIIANHFKTENIVPLAYKSIKGLNHIKGVRLIDQSPIGKTPRSNPATYLKIFDSIRKIYSQQPEAKAYGYSPGFFSFNIAGGRCEACKGEGYQKIEMYFFEDLYVRCEQCDGTRYSREALQVFYNGKNISDVLNMTISEAKEFFINHLEVYNRLDLLEQIGIGYLKLGQPANTLSGGEAQRLKICSELMSSSVYYMRSLKGMLYILDEPTVGLHYCDVMKFMNIIFKLLKANNTIILIEHNLDVINLADYVIDLGPDGGDDGGRVIFEGSPMELIECKSSSTGRYLKEFINGHNNNTYKL